MKQLLCQSMQHIEIRSKTIDKPLSISEYKKLYQPTKSRKEIYVAENVTQSDLLKVTYSPGIEDDFTKSELLNFLKDELNPYVKNGFISSCLSMQAYSLDDFVRSILRVSIVWGVERAVSVFEKCVDKESSVDMKEIALLEGLDYEREQIEIYDGVKLVTRQHLLALCPNFRSSSFVREGVPDLFGGNFLVVDYSLSPIFSEPPKSLFPKNKPFQTKINSTERTDFSITGFCNILSLVCNNRIRPIEIPSYFHGEQVDFGYLTGGDVKIGGFSSGGFRHVLDKDFLASHANVSNENLEKAKELYDKVYGSNNETFELLRTVVIPRWVKANKRKHEYIDAMIDLGIAFESLYMKDEERGISFKLQMRAAWYLGNNFEERQSLMEGLKAFYNCRSDAVHKGKISEKVKVGREKVTIFSLFEQSKQLCRESILKVIEDGKFPDWNSLILGERVI